MEGFEGKGDDMAVGCCSGHRKQHGTAHWQQRGKLTKGTEDVPDGSRELAVEEEVAYEV